ncbi:MAG: 5-(carboxyamino)imidazole ribonucleotide mutase [Geobacteraceae bacterium]|jgi:5-(carboxyamino)imidazole ribonucleotide mutase|nr:5-(carboxyamino)imidazole ribonucleotide mutase [Geobacteraceae bacterium]
MYMPQVLIVMGSDSDIPVMEKAAKVLDEFGVPCEMRISSAHRCPHRTATLAAEAAGRGIKVIIAGAGMAAHLSGVIAAETVLPVIGVPIGGGALNGLDALYSTVQMPAGIPVATVAIGKAGAKNAGILAVQMLALADDGLADRLREYKSNMAREVEAKDMALQDARKAGAK